jgi:predicted dienelactone hydrolase
VAVFVQHPGSDDSVWKGVRLSDRRAAMNRAASGENFMLRVGDIPAVLDQLEQWNAAAGHKLHGRLDMTKVGMSGHSFGAITTQAVSGQTALAGKGFTDARIDAAVIMSPSGPRRGDAATAFGNVKTPWLLMTGTHDLSVIGNIDMASRLSVYPALPPGGKYELVLDGAEHSAFTERALPGDQKPRNPNHHRAILALSTAFWDAYLLQNADARHWLDHTGPPTLLQPADQWQSK